MINDNAGGGARGLRAEPSPALYKAVQNAYPVEIEAEPVDLGGSVNLNLLITSASGKRVLRVYRPWVTVERLEAIQAARQTLLQAGVPCDRPVETRSKRTWAAFGSRLMELVDYVEPAAEMDTWETLAAGMPVLARIHAALQHMPAGPAARQPLFANYIEPAQALPRTLLGASRIRSWNPSQSERDLADEAEKLARRVSSAECGMEDRLPRQLVHGDFWDNNVYLRGGRVVYVADFDFMGIRSRIDDIALTLFFACMEYFEECASDTQLARLRALLDAYDLGADRPLSAAERAALPAAIARQPLWSIGGWVASLDDEGAARAHAAGTAAEVQWANRLMDELERWQSAFTG